MRTVLGPAESLARAHGRGLLLTTLETEALLTTVKVDSGGHLSLETKDWDEYWKPLQDMRHGGLIEALSGLRSSWSKYIRNYFRKDFRREFCFRYFRLLDQMLYDQEAVRASEVWTHALQAVLGFECFMVTSPHLDGKAVVAGTTTIRNPCYLLSKLKMPTALDDPQFLPMITSSNAPHPELYYHYRQYRLSLDSRSSCTPLVPRRIVPRVSELSTGSREASATS